MTREMEEANCEPDGLFQEKINKAELEEIQKQECIIEAMMWGICIQGEV